MVKHTPNSFDSSALFYFHQHHHFKTLILPHIISASSSIKEDRKNPRRPSFFHTHIRGNNIENHHTKKPQPLNRTHIKAKKYNLKPPNTKKKNNHEKSYIPSSCTFHYETLNKKNDKKNLTTFNSRKTPQLSISL